MSANQKSGEQNQRCVIAVTENICNTLGSYWFFYKEILFMGITILKPKYQVLNNFSVECQEKQELMILQNKNYCKPIKT